MGRRQTKHRNFYFLKCGILQLLIFLSPANSNEVANSNLATPLDELGDHWTKEQRKTIYSSTMGTQSFQSGTGGCSPSRYASTGASSSPILGSYDDNAVNGGGLNYFIVAFLYKNINYDISNRVHILKHGDDRYGGEYKMIDAGQKPHKKCGFIDYELSYQKTGAYDSKQNETLINDAIEVKLDKNGEVIKGNNGDPLNSGDYDNTANTDTNEAGKILDTVYDNGCTKDNENLYEEEDSPKSSKSGDCTGNGEIASEWIKNLEKYDRAKK